MWPNRIVPPVLFANNQWAVTNLGIESLTRPFVIDKRDIGWRVGQVSMWILWMSYEKWVDLGLFNEALMKALFLHKKNGRTIISVECSIKAILEDKEISKKWSEFFDSLGGVSDDPMEFNVAYDLYKENFPEGFGKSFLERDALYDPPIERWRTLYSKQ